MTDPADTARVSILLGEFANVDNNGRINLIGFGPNFVGYEAAANATVPFSVVAQIYFDHTQTHKSPSIELVLEDHQGQVVSIPGPTGQAGPLVRVGKSDPLQAVSFPTPLEVDADPLDPVANFILNFSSGLPLPPGRTYSWQVIVDSQRRPEWGLRFCVPGVALPPTIG